MKTGTWLVLVGGLWLTLVSTGWALDEQFNCEATVAVKSKHLWRGQLINEDWIFQPGISAAYGRLSGGLTANIGLTDAHGRKYEVQRADFFAAFTESLEGIEWINYSLGIMQYDYVRERRETTEVYGQLDFDMALSPSLACYFESHNADGAYLSVSIARTVQSEVDMIWGSPLKLDLGAKLGWGSSNYNSKYWGVAEGQLNDFVLSAAMPLTLWGYDVVPEIAYVGIVGQKIKDSTRYSDDNTSVFFGVGISKSF